MNERIRMIRDKLDFSRASFGEKMGVSGDVINNLERGRVEVKDSMVKLICSIYSVREAWLRTGEGEMFEKRSEEEELSVMVERLITGESAAFKKRLVNALSTLKDEHWLLLEAKLKEIVDMRTAAPAVDSKREATPQTEPDLAAKVAELERQNDEKDRRLQELSARLSVMEEEDELFWHPDTGNLA